MLDELGRAILGILGVDEPEIRFLATPWPFGNFVMIDPIHIDDDAAFRSLAKHFRQAGDWNGTGFDDVEGPARRLREASRRHRQATARLAVGSP
jgi:hypothetical protein